MQIVPPGLTTRAHSAISRGLSGTWHQASWPMHDDRSWRRRTAYRARCRGENPPDGRGVTKLGQTRSLLR